MRKFLLIVAALMVFAGQAYAAPVDVSTARNLGVKYLRNNVLSAKDITDVELVYTLTSENNTPYLYVFNYENGFVVMAADDRACPVLAYSDGDIFDENNIPDGMRYYLGHYGREIQYAIDNEMAADEEVVAQWDLLRKEGVIMKTRMPNVVSPLLSTTWNQDYPYNYYAPACNSSWIGNHCYAGCVATAMSQVMKYWNWPVTGVGEHSYSTSTYGGTLSVNFGEATYNWAIMPNQLGSQANDAAKAVALLMYHCGVSVDMDYTPQGSGAHTEDVPDAVIEHFRYGACTYVDSRDSYTKSVWEDKLIETLDRGIPMVYAGSDSDGGHAFNCDGYNNQRYFHFNWGWSGQYNNTYYQIDALNTGNGSFNSYQRTVFEMVPDYVYDAMVPEIETMAVDVTDAITKTAVVNFTVPTVSASGAELASIEKIILKRNGTTIHTFENPQPGETLSYEDNVNDYGAYEYTIVGVNNNIEGKLFSQVAIFGPNCTWKFICQTTNVPGWNSGMLQAVGANGTVFATITMTNSTPMTKKIQFPEGDFSLKWINSVSTVSSITITLKNSAGETAYSFSGSSSQLNGTIYSGNNDCPNCTAPTDFTGEFAYVNDSFGARLNWNCEYQPSKFKVYRSADGINYTEVGNVNGDVHEFFEEIDNGIYYYKVTAFSSACESNPAVTEDGTDYVVVEVASVAENAINARIYPNPTTGILKIETETQGTVTVFNLVGQKLYENNIDGNECVINMKEFGIGVYMVGIMTGTGSTTQKVYVIE